VYYLYKKEFHSDAYFAALMLMAGSLPLSKFAMSVMQFTLLGLWLWSGFSFLKASSLYNNKGVLRGTLSFLGYLLTLSKKNITGKFRIFFRNRAAMLLVSLFIIHLIGLVHTSDFGYAMKDLRTKLPLLAFPVILSTMEPLNSKRFRAIMLFHAAAVLIGTFFSLHELFKGDFSDIRKISVFISPIRFGLNICIAIFSLLYFSVKNNIFSVSWRMIMFLAAIWLIMFLFILESGIGIIVLLSLSFIFLVSFVFTIKNLYYKTAFIVALVIGPLALYVYLNQVVTEFNKVEPIDFKTLDKYTLSGNSYYHDTIWIGIEDGKYVGLYLQWDELEREWNKKSTYNFKGKDDNGQDIKFTIIRYLASKNLRKDSAGVAFLDSEDIRAIERGIANVNYLKNPSLKTRISKIMLGYHRFQYDQDPNGSSVLQRFEYWKASLGLIGKYLWTGVGTGDIKNEFNQYYEETSSPLEKQNRWRSHNQFLSVFVTLGLFGFLWFVFTLIYPPLKRKMYFDYFYVVFFITIVLSMLTEDTIESQEGVTLFAFFNSFLLFGRK